MTTSVRSSIYSAIFISDSLSNVINSHQVYPKRTAADQDTHCLLRLAVQISIVNKYSFHKKLGLRLATNYS